MKYSFPEHLYATYIIVFSLMSMVGIAIGTSITSGVTDDSVPYATMVGILQVRLIEQKITEIVHESQYFLVSLYASLYYDIVQLLGTSRRNNLLRMCVRNT